MPASARSWRRLLAAKKATAGDLLLALSTGQATWGAAMLRVV
jgi:hypothetical protein